MTKHEFPSPREYLREWFCTELRKESKDGKNVALMSSVFFFLISATGNREYNSSFPFARRRPGDGDGGLLEHRSALALEDGTPTSSRPVRGKDGTFSRLPSIPNRGFEHSNEDRTCGGGRGRSTHGRFFAQSRESRPHRRNDFPRIP